MPETEGILFIQLGSPESLDKKAIGKYLYEFLGNKHTLGNPPFFWKPLLRSVILPKAKNASFEKYRKMFELGNFSEMPLVTHSKNFLSKVQEEFPEKKVALAFQYGSSPSIRDILLKWKSESVNKIYALPLYPQRAGATTEAAKDSLIEGVKKTHYLGNVFFAEGFSHLSAWISESANLIAPFLKKNSTLLLSFHGMQQWRIDAGDPYEIDCQKSAQSIGEALSTTPIICYQSRYGKGKWLSPSLTSTLQHLGEKHADVVISTPSFIADNLETIFEIDYEAKEIFLRAGGKNFTRAPCLNARNSWVRAFAREIFPALSFFPLACR